MPVGVIALVIAGVLYFLWRRRQRQSKETPPSYHEKRGYPDTTNQRHMAPAELPVSEPRVELDGTSSIDQRRSRGELE